MLNTVFDIDTKVAKLRMPKTRMKPIRAAPRNFREGDIFQGGIRILIHSGRRRLPPPETYRSTEDIGIGKTNSRGVDEPAGAGAWKATLFDSGVTAFVVWDTIASKFVFRTQFDMELMPFGFAFNNAGVWFGNWLVSQNVLVSHRESEGPDDTRKVL